MKIYTRRGDAGETGLFGGERVSKAHLRVEAYGTLDELNAVLGLCVEGGKQPETRDWLRRIQRDLFDLGASLAVSGSEAGKANPSIPPVPEGRVDEMEEWIDLVTEETPELRAFILPGGTRSAGLLHLARTICRRGERAVVRLNQVESSDPGVIRYLNRLSDLLFALARLENVRQGVSDVLWKGEESGSP